MMIRTRTTGNFLWDIFASALPSKQMEFKEKLVEMSGGTPFKLWQSFNRIQTDVNKDDNFNSDIIGVMVQVFCENEIKVKFELTDVQKLRLKHKMIKQQQTTLPLWKQSVTLS